MGAAVVGGLADVRCRCFWSRRPCSSVVCGVARLGLFQRKLSMPQRTWRAGCLFFCQGIVNLSAPHLFDAWTPGVLSLLGLLVLTEGVWMQPFRRSEAPARAFALTALAMVGATHAMHAWQGPSIWTERVVVDDPVEWFQHLMATGLYPLFPWITFAAFGASVAACNERQRRELITEQRRLLSVRRWLCWCRACATTSLGRCQRATPP